MCKNCLRSIKNYRKKLSTRTKKMSRANILITYNLLVNQIKKTAITVLAYVSGFFGTQNLD